MLSETFTCDLCGKVTSEKVNLWYVCVCVCVLGLIFVHTHLGKTPRERLHLSQCSTNSFYCSIPDPLKYLTMCVCVSVSV